MSEKIDTIISSLNKFGLTELEAKAYLVILGGRGDTALTISRTLRIARTKVYRLLDNLINKGFVATGQGDRGSRFVAAPPDDLELIIKNKESELRSLKSSLPRLQDELKDLSQTSSGPVRVRYFHGLDGLKQVTYNSLKAKGELLTYELETMNSFLSKEEAEEFRQRFVDNKVKIRTLTNAGYLEPWTNVSEMVEKFWEIRYLDPGEKPFQFEILIYNDVYCMYRYVDKDIFCIEIHSEELADQQRQLFEHLWDTARKFRILDAHGTAKLV